MKKDFLILVLILFASQMAKGQSLQKYARFGKLTTTEINAIDVSRTDVIYTAYDTTLGMEVINTGFGWIPRIAVSLDPIPTDGSTNGVESNGVFDALAGKLSLGGGTMTGPLDLDENDITSVRALTASSSEITDLTAIEATINDLYVEVDADINANLRITGGYGITLPPTNIVNVPSTEGSVYADDSENRPMYHDGTSFKKFLLEGDASGGSLGESDQTLTGNREVDLDGNNLQIVDGAADIITFSNGVVQLGTSTLLDGGVISFDNTGTGLTSTNVRDAISELDGNSGDPDQTLSLGGTELDELSISGGNTVTLPIIANKDQAVSEDRHIIVTGTGNSFEIGPHHADPYFSFERAANSADDRVTLGKSAQGLSYTYNEGFRFTMPFSVYTSDASSPPSHHMGRMWYDSTNGVLKINNGTSWEDVGAGIGTENQLRVDNLNKYRRIVISSDAQTSTAANAYTSDTPYEGKVKTVINGNYTYFLNNAEPLNTPFLIEAGESVTDSVEVLRSNGNIKFSIDGVETILTSDDKAGFALRALKTAVVERYANNEYKITCNCYSIEGAYSPNNLYVEASAVNNDNYAATLGSWSQFQSDPSQIQASTVNSGYGQGSIYFYDPTPNTYSQINLDTYSPPGLQPNTDYIVRFRYRFLQGQDFVMLMGGTSSDDGSVTIDSTPNPSDTFANNGVFEYHFTSDATPSPLLVRIYGSFNGSGVPDEFYIADFEIVEDTP